LRACAFPCSSCVPVEREIILDGLQDETRRRDSVQESCAREAPALLPSSAWIPSANGDAIDRRSVAAPPFRKAFSHSRKSLAGTVGDAGNDLAPARAAGTIQSGDSNGRRGIRTSPLRGHGAAPITR
jgi:hypothetical protein